MVVKACIGEIEKAAGRPLSEDELDQLDAELRSRRRQKMAADSVPDLEAVAMQAADELQRDILNAAFIAKRNAALNAKAQLTAKDFVRSQFAGREEKGLEAWLVGINSARFNSRGMSAAGQQEMLIAYYGGGFVSDMERAGHWQLFVSGTYDRQIARALWALETDEAALAKMPKEAVDMAKVVRKWQEVARTDANKAGAWIGKEPGYVVRQSHDVFRIKSKGYAAWKAAVTQRLDMGRTFGDVTGDELEAALQKVYDGLSTGIHLKAKAEATGFKGPRNLAKKMSQERVLHFKSADDWYDYNTEFGSASLREAILGGLENSAKSTGLMRKLGPNPEASFDAMVDDIKRGLSGERLTKFTTGAELMKRTRFPVIDGSARIPANQMGARISSGLRAWQNMAKLGAAVISSVTDIPVRASELRYQGDGGYLGNIGAAVSDLFKGRNRREMAEIDGSIGVFMDSMRGDVVSRFSIAEDGVPGTLSRLQRQFFKWNGLTWWTDVLRAGAIRSMSHRAALNKGKAFDKLDSEYQRVLGLFGIDAKRWDTIRAAVTKEADGRQYLTPDAIADRETADMFRNYLVDRGNIAVIEPDARTRSIMTRGSKPGTVEGEFLRFVGQFKSFVFAFTQNVIGREVYGRGADNLGQALRNGNGEMLGLAKLILMTTAFGYAAMAAKDIVKGRTPRDPRDPKTWAAAMTQGGGFGIYGDFLFGELRTRFGGGPISTALGPVAGTIEDVMDLYGRVINGDDVAATALKTLTSNTPFLNMFYTRIALDYLLLYNLAEAANPGSLRRMEQRIEKENSQTFLIRPSQWVQ